MSGPGMDFKVTHIDPQGLKRVRVVRGAAGGPAALEWMEQLYGEAQAASAVYLGPKAAHEQQGGAG